MRSALLGEFAGTFMMMLLGDGVVAACLLKGTKATGQGWMVITSAWAFAVLCGIFTANLFGSPDAHLNPAITVAFAVTSGDFRDFGPRLAHALLPIHGKGGSDWAYSWVPVLGPVIGAASAGAVLKVISA